MKKMKSVLSFLLVLCLCISISPVSYEKTENTEFDELKNDITKINSLNEDEIAEFYNQNQEWIEAVDVRLTAYLNTLHQEVREAALKELLGQNVTARAYSGKFDWYTYGYRNGYWTYNVAGPDRQPVKIPNSERLTRGFS